MKKFLGLLAVLLLCANASEAKGEKDGKESDVDISFTIAPGISWLNASGNDNDTKTKFGFDYGVNVDYFFADNDRYAFATGVMVSNFKSGLSYTDEVSGQEIEMDYKLKYIELPMALRLYTSQFNRSQYWVQFGLFMGFNVSAHADSSDGAYSNDKVKSHVNFFNVGLDLGIGTKYDLGGNNAIGVAIVYKNGFTKAIDRSFVGSNGTNALSLQLSYIF